MTTSLEKVLLAIAEKTGHSRSDSARRAVTDLLWEHELDHPDAVPDWLLELFRRIANETTTEWESFPIEGYNFSNVFNLLAELDQVLPVSYQHLEESIELTFHSLGLVAEIWVESDQLRIRRTSSESGI